jgi:acetyl-CoA C-acetyltransferase
MFTLMPSRVSALGLYKRKELFFIPIPTSRNIYSSTPSSVMAESVGIVGVGFEGFRPAVSDLSTRELMFEAASKAYDDAGVDARSEIGSFISCAEDLWEGWSITDEMVPDQIGGARRPLCTVSSDGMTGLGHAVMQIRTGVADVVAVEAHSKVADVIDKEAVENLAIEPTYLRALGVSTDTLAGLEMSGFLKTTAFTREDCSQAVVTMKARALKNLRASFGGIVSVREVQASEPKALPLRFLDKAPFAEAGIVIVLASEFWIRKNKRDPVYVDGIAWRSSAPWYEDADFRVAPYATESFRAAARMANLRGGISALDVMEVDDTYSYKLLQHLNSITGSREATMRLVRRNSPLLNPSGGSIGCGNLIEASGLHRILECVYQLRGIAGKNQVPKARRALALSWRGNPTASGCTAILSR